MKNRSAAKPGLAIVSHDRLKAWLRGFLRPWVPFLDFFLLYATDGTARILREMGLHAEPVGHGPRGGDRVLINLIRQGKVQAIIFAVDPRFSDPNFREEFPHFEDIRDLIVEAVVAGIPCAFNPISIALILPQLVAYQAPIIIPAQPIPRLHPELVVSRERSGTSQGGA